jgi:membrane associated rhomboid family serine protease
MSSGADLFVVCKQCGSEVSPYITECPYCGSRLRRRAPKLPRENQLGRSPRGLSRRLRWRRARAGRPVRTATRSPLLRLTRDRAQARPYVTIALVTAGAGAWVASHARPRLYLEMGIFGPLHGDWWRLLTSPFAYVNGLYAFAALLTVAIFGWLLERRNGPAVVLALFFGAGAAGALAAISVYSDAIVTGANAGALALLAAWAARDLRAAGRGFYYEGDLLGTGAIAAVVLAVPFSRPEASWLAGLTGGAVGLLVGLGLAGVEQSEP